MAVRSQETARPPSPRLNTNKFVAVFAWIVGCATTWLGLTVFLPGAPWWLPLGVAIGMQVFLTAAERAIWKGRPSLVGIFALLIDVALNAGGIFPYAMMVGATPTAQMIVTVAGGSRQVAPVTAMIVAIALGFLIAAAPEELWSRKD